MTERLSKIYSELPQTEVFADVGCDHGYIAKAMLKNGKCRKAVISDISEKCLRKAQTLLQSEIEAGTCVSVVSDGFEKIGKVDCALIAGLGGEEIIHVLENAKNLPERLVLQPMKNADKVREVCVEKGYKIIKDFVFKADGVYYVLITLVKGTDRLTEDEKEFGRTNISERPQDFTDMLNEEIFKLKSYSARPNISDKTKAEMEKRAERLSKYVKS